MASAFEIACLESRIPVASLREIRLRDVTIAEIFAPTIIFVHATWSGQSRASWTLLTRVLAEFETCPQVLVADSDLLSEDDRLLLCRLGDEPGGRGETYWIRDGQVIECLAKRPQGRRVVDMEAFVRRATERLMLPGS